MDWDGLLAGTVPAPWVPETSGILDTSLFDRRFTGMPIVSPTQNGSGGLDAAMAGRGADFGGFTYEDEHPRMHDIFETKHVRRQQQLAERAAVAVAADAAAAAADAVNSAGSGGADGGLLFGRDGGDAEGELEGAYGEADPDSDDPSDYDDCEQPTAVIGYFSPELGSFNCTARPAGGGAASLIPGLRGGRIPPSQLSGGGASGIPHFSLHGGRLAETEVPHDQLRADAAAGGGRGGAGQLGATASGRLQAEGRGGGGGGSDGMLICAERLTPTMPAMEMDGTAVDLDEDAMVLGLSLGPASTGHMQQHLGPPVGV